MAAVSGFGGRVVVRDTLGNDSRILPAGRWQVIGSVELIPITSVASLGIHEYIVGYANYEATVDCFWDQGFHTFQWNPQLRPGDTVQLFLYFNKANPQSAFIFRQFIISSVTCDEEVRNVFRYTLAGRQSSYRDSASHDGVSDGVTFPFNPV